VPSLFRRKSDRLVEDALTESAPDQVEVQRTRGYTPGKGRATPKRPRAGTGREAPPTDRKEAARRARERERAARSEQRAGMMAGDERYLLPRDKGAERALVRDIVDSRRTAGTWFFSFAFVLLVISSVRALPGEFVLTANLVWLLLGFGVVLDSILICRKINKLVTERYPKYQQRMTSLYLYAIMRALSYRRFRMPKPRVKVGDKV
jgi:Protein of unknown function (DUF3043)